MTLQDIWNNERLVTTLSDYYNKINTKTPLGVTGDPSETSVIVTILQQACANLMNCEVVYSTQEEGVKTLDTYVKYVAIPLVTEFRAQIFATSNDMGKTHMQVKFNPLDNDNIENGTIASDNLTFNYADNLGTNIDFLLSNSKTIKTFLSFLRRDIYLVV